MDEDAGDEVLSAMPLVEPVMGLSFVKYWETKNPEYEVGDKLMARFAWQEYSIGKPGDFIAKLPNDLAFPYGYVGVLGDTGMSAYFALTEIASPKGGNCSHKCRRGRLDLLPGKSPKFMAPAPWASPAVQKM